MTTIPTTPLEQLAVTVSGLGFKPLYMLLTAIIVAWLWRQRTADLTLIRRGMVAFLAGEAFCATNYLATGSRCEELEMLHGAGMVVMGALLLRGLFRLLDQRVLRLSDQAKPCAFVRLCRQCARRDPVSCGLQRIFLYLAIACAVVAMLPWSVPLRPIVATMPVFGADVLWPKTSAVLTLEFRVYPTAAALLFALSAVRLRGPGSGLHRAEGFFFWGLGFLAYALFRFFLFSSFRHAPAWADFWEETTELIMVVGLLAFLWTFRSQLGLRPAGGQP